MFRLLSVGWMVEEQQRRREGPVSSNMTACVRLELVARGLGSRWSMLADDRENSPYVSENFNIYYYFTCIWIFYYTKRLDRSLREVALTRHNYILFLCLFCCREKGYGQQTDDFRNLVYVVIIHQDIVQNAFRIMVVDCHVPTWNEKQNPHTIYVSHLVGWNLARKQLCARKEIGGGFVLITKHSILHSTLPLNLLNFNKFVYALCLEFSHLTIKTDMPDHPQQYIMFSFLTYSLFVDC